jgi:hypothetical protein
MQNRTPPSAFARRTAVPIVARQIVELASDGDRAWLLCPCCMCWRDLARSEHFETDSNEITTWLRGACPAAGGAFGG